MSQPGREWGGAHLLARTLKTGRKAAVVIARNAGIKTRQYPGRPVEYHLGDAAKLAAEVEGRAA
jgi:hypothetical protein